MIDQKTTDRSNFWSWSPAAKEIFEHIENNEELKKSPWGFDLGFIAKDRKRSSASFSYISISGWGRDKLHVNAVKVKNVWNITYNIERA